MSDPGPLEAMMLALVDLEETVHQDLTVRMLRESSMELPALYNLLDPSPGDFVNQIDRRETIKLAARIVIPPGDSDEENVLLLRYADAFMAVVDPALNASDPLGGTVRMAKRTGMRGSLDEFAQVPVLGIDFALELQLERRRITLGS